MPKKLLVLDLDETILSRHGERNSPNDTLNQAARGGLTKHIYLSDLLYKHAYSLYPTKFRALFSMVENHNLNSPDDAIEIAFITAGHLSREKIKGFFHSQYDYDLGDNLHHHKLIRNSHKVSVMEGIADRLGVKKTDVVFSDNILANIKAAENAGFTSSIHADNNNLPDNKKCTDGGYIDAIARQLFGEGIKAALSTEPESRGHEISRRYIPRPGRDVLTESPSWKKGEMFTRYRKDGNSIFAKNDALIDRHRHLAARIAATLVLCLLSAGVLALVGLIQYGCTSREYKRGSFLLLKPTRSRELVADILDAESKVSSIEPN